MAEMTLAEKARAARKAAEDATAPPKGDGSKPKKSLADRAKEIRAGNDIVDASKETAGEASDVGSMADAAISFGSGIPRGILSLLGIPGSLEAAGKESEYEAAKKLYALPESEKAKFRDMQFYGRPVDMGRFFDKPPVQRPRSGLPTMEEVISGTASMLPESLQPALTYEPKTAYGRIARTAGEFTGGALIPGGLTSSTLKAAAPYSAVGALAGAAEEVEPGYGGILGMGLTVPVAVMQAKKGRATKILEDIKSARPEALALQAAGKQVGVPLSAAETLGSEQVKTLAEQAAKQPSAARILDPMIEARATQIPEAIERGLLEVSTPIEAPLGVSRQASKAAEKAVKEAKGVRSDAVDALYKRAKTQNIEPSSIQKVVDKAESEKVNRSPAVQKEIDDYIKQLFDKDGNPITNLGALDDIYATTRDAQFIPVTTKAEAGKAKASGAVAKINKELKAVTNVNDDLRAARELFEAESETFATKVGDTGVESIAKAGSNPNAVISAISGPKARAGTIKSVADQLNKQDKTVFPKVARYYFEEASSKALKDKPVERAFRFVDSVRGTKLKKQNFDAIISGVARAKGRNEERVVRAANKLMDVLKATEETKALRSSSGVTEPVKAEGGLLSRGLLGITDTISDKMRNMGAKKFYKQFAEAMVSDDSIEALEKLARTNATRDQYAAFLNSLIVSSREPTGGLLAGEQDTWYK